MHTSCMQGLKKAGFFLLSIVRVKMERWKIPPGPGRIILERIEAPVDSLLKKDKKAG